jgi:hypothetical protein
MQTPPPFQSYESQPAPKKPKTSAVVIIFAILGVLLVCCGAPLGIAGYFGFKGFKGAMAIGGCMANVTEMRQALGKYSAAHDGKLPSAATWQKDIGKYLADKDTKDAPMKFWKAGEEWSCEEGGAKTGFMFNDELSGKKVSDVVKANPDAIAIFETKTVGFNQAGKLVKLPFNESPKILSDFLKERRGWMLIDADASTLKTWDEKDGHLKTFDMNMKNGKNGKSFNFNMDSNTDSNSSKDSANSKDDNSN